MVQCPFKKGDSITLKHQYLIVDFLEETQKYWLLEAVQIPNQQNVLIKIYINEKFPSINEAEAAWNNEIFILKSKIDDQNLPIEYIESGTLTFAADKLFVIVLNYIEGSKAKIEQQKEESTDDEMESELEESRMEEIHVPEIITEKKREEIVHEAPPSALSEIDKSYKKMEELPPTPKKPSIASGAAPTPPITDDKPSKPSAKPSRKRSKSSIRDQEQKEAPIEFSGIELVEEKDYLKHISMEYFDRMNPQNYYPLTLNISDIKQDEIAPEVNIITGERKVQDQSQLDAKLKNPIVKIRPTLPGCSVVPREIETDFSNETDEVTFYVTPGVKGEIIGHIKFINEGKIFHTTDFKAKVVDPNYARIVAFYGILASFVPKILSMLGMDIGLSATISSLSSQAIAVVGDMNIASLIAIGGVLPVIVASLLVRQRLKPKSKRIQYRIADFRLKNLKLS